MSITLDTIKGMSIGIEYVEPEDKDGPHSVIVDVFILRFLIQWL